MIKNLIKLCVTAVFIIVLSSFVSSSDLLELFQNIDWFFFSLSVLLGFVMLGVSCTKWKLMLNEPETNIGFLALFKIYFIGYFFSNLLPSTVGGDVVRSYYAGKFIQNQAYAAVSIFVERFTGLLFLLFLVVTAPLLRLESYLSPFFLVPAVGAASLLVLIILLWKASEPVSKLEKVLTKVVALIGNIAGMTGMSLFSRIHHFASRATEMVMVKINRFHGELARAVSLILVKKQVFLNLILLTLLFYFLTWLNVYLSFRAFHLKPDFLAICALVPTIMFVAQIPVTILGNLGFFESVFIFYFSLVHIPAAETLAMGLLLRFKVLLLGLIGLGVYLLYKDKDTPGLGREVVSEQENVA